MVMNIIKAFVRMAKGIPPNKEFFHYKPHCFHLAQKYENRANVYCVLISINKRKRFTVIFKTRLGDICAFQIKLYFCLGSLLSSDTLY